MACKGLSKDKVKIRGNLLTFEWWLASLLGGSGIILSTMYNSRVTKTVKELLQGIQKAPNSLNYALTKGGLGITKVRQLRLESFWADNTVRQPARNNVEYF